jgi:hypothetical protein
LINALLLSQSLIFCKTDFSGADKQIMVSSNDKAGTLLFGECITPPRRSSQFSLPPPSPDQDPSEDKVPSSIPLRPLCGHNVVVPSIPIQTPIKLCVDNDDVDNDDVDDYSYTEEDVNNYLMATQQTKKTTRSAKLSAGLKSASGKQQTMIMIQPNYCMIRMILIMMTISH